MTSDILDDQKDTLQITVVNFGEGVVEPTDRYTDSEVASEIEWTQEPVQDEHIVCMDERSSVEGNQPVRLKSAGGAGMGVFEAAILTDWYLLATIDTPENPVFAKGQANRVYDFAVQKASETGIKLGNHIDNTAEGSKTHCGARDGAPVANSKLATRGEEFAPVVAHFMGEEFDAELYETVIKRVKLLEDIEFFDGWDPSQSIETDAKLGGITEVLDGTKNYEDIDPKNLRHGHLGEAANHNKRHGFSNNRDASVIPYFQFDDEAIEKLASATARNEHEQKLNKHAIYAYTVAICHGIIKNQRISQT